MAYTGNSLGISSTTAQVPFNSSIESGEFLNIYEELSNNGNRTEGYQNTTLLLEHAPVLTESGLVRAIVLSAIAVISFFGNVATLVSIRRTQRRSRSTVYMLIGQLAVADLFVTVFCMIVEAVWTATVQWYFGDSMCKFLKFMQVFSLYLSTFILVIIGIDRCLAIRFPMKKSDFYQRCYFMVIGVWFLSAILSIPQLVIFRVQQGPFVEEFYQCVTHGFYTEHWQEQLYTTTSLVLMFLLPLICLLISYACTFYTIAKSEIMFKGEINSSMSRTCIVRGKLIRKAKFKSLQITIVIVLVFIICWTPYYTMMVVFMFLDPDEQLSADLQTGIFFFGMSNSMFNPLIYGAFHLRKRGPRRPINQSEASGAVQFSLIRNSFHSLKRNTVVGGPNRATPEAGVRNSDGGVKEALVNKDGECDPGKDGRSKVRVNFNGVTNNHENCDRRNGVRLNSHEEHGL